MAAWEQSPGAQYVNSSFFPQGWADALDSHTTAQHWIVEDGGRIVAAARVVLLDTLEESGQDFSRFTLPIERPYCYYSRLVMLPAYRKSGLALSFDKIRLHYLQTVGVAFAIATTHYKHLDSLLALGWTHIGDMPFVAVGNAPQLFSSLCLWQPASSSQSKAPFT